MQDFDVLLVRADHKPLIQRLIGLLQHEPDLHGPGRPTGDDKEAQPAVENQATPKIARNLSEVAESQQPVESSSGKTQTQQAPRSNLEAKDCEAMDSAPLL